MEATSSPTCSHTVLVLPSTSTAEPILKLRLEKKKSPKQVVWSDGTVDNEHMNKKKSKCCCIYKKPLAFGESSSEEEEDCEHCYGHPEKRIKSQRKPHPDRSVTSDPGNEAGCCVHHTAQLDSELPTSNGPDDVKEE